MQQTPSTALIFGASGQDGVHLQRLCAERGVRAVAVSRHSVDTPGDVGNYDCVEDLVQRERPDLVFHLAADAGARDAVIAANARTIAGGTWNLCEALLRHHPQGRLFVAGSGLQFLNRGRPIDENAPFAALSANDLQRTQAVETVRHYRGLGLRGYIGYLFHHDSAERDERHLTMKIARAAFEIAAGRRESLQIGHVGVCKEWGHAAEIVEGMWTLVTQDCVFEAVIGTGEAHPVSAWLHLCFAHVGLDWRNHVTPHRGFEPAFETLVSDPHTMRRLGWTASRGLEDLCREIMQRVSSGPCEDSDIAPAVGRVDCVR